MYPKKIAQGTASVLQSYLTYQAVCVIIDQLSETNPTQAIWLRQYVSSHNIQQGEAFVSGLMTDNKELVLRILTVREHLAEEILEFLPDMVRAQMGQANMEHRRQLLERLTKSSSVSSSCHPDCYESDNDD
jgi:hypothetical protein